MPVDMFTARKLIYVAAPYSSIEDKDALLHDIFRYCGEYMLAHPFEYLVPGLMHHHAVKSVPHLGSDYDFWGSFCEEIIRRSDEILVLTYTGWETSKGTQAEIAFANEIGMPVRYADPTVSVFGTHL